MGGSRTLKEYNGIGSKFSLRYSARATAVVLISVIKEAAELGGIAATSATDLGDGDGFGSR
jgi:hypothetical protein